VQPEERPTCPKCGGTNIAEIFYGMPREIDMDAIERGDVVYAGCCVYLGKSCRWKCNACGDRFGVIDSSSDDKPEYEVIKALP